MALLLDKESTPPQKGRFLLFFHNFQVVQNHHKSFSSTMLLQGHYSRSKDVPKNFLWKNFKNSRFLEHELTPPPFWPKKWHFWRYLNFFGVENFLKKKFFLSKNHFFFYVSKTFLGCFEIILRLKKCFLVLKKEFISCQGVSIEPPPPRILIQYKVLTPFSSGTFRGMSTIPCSHSRERYGLWLL